MRLQPVVVLFSLGCSSIACDAAEPREDDADAARAAATPLDTVAAYFAPRPSCPSYSCGLNSPFIGHELNLAGDPNDLDVKFLYAKDADRDLVTLHVEGDELVALSGERTLRGQDLLGLTLTLEGKVKGTAVPLSVELVEVANVQMWAEGPNGASAVPSYRFLYSSPGIERQLLCPSPTEGAAPDLDEIALARTQGELLAAGKLDDLKELNDQQAGTNRPYHTVVFSGERFDYDTARIYEHDATDWFNWGCSGSSAAKLHLSGHTAAAGERVGFDSPVTPEIQQAVLYAYTATYCPGGRRMTVPGHPLRLAEVRGVLARDGEVSFEPRASGTVEALWGPTGARCISTPRLETDGIYVWDEIGATCPGIPQCPDRGTIMEADAYGQLLDPLISVVTFNLDPDSCQGRCGTDGPDWNCKPTCVSEGTCGSDYAELCT